MKKSKYGELIFDDNDVVDIIMSGKDMSSIKNLKIETDIEKFHRALALLEQPGLLNTWTEYNTDQTLSVNEFDALQQQQWYMPDEAKDFDIAEYILTLCESSAELQRCGKELLLFQERGLFDLLKYLHYLVQVMQKNNVVWGVGRGSSVASYVLYKLGVHRIDSIYYDLDPEEFLR